MKEPVLLGWSGGKDSALALQEILKEDKYSITLLTTITEDYKRISMHGVREELLQAQADSLNLPLAKVYIPKECSNEDYDRLMENALKRYLSSGYRSMIFGDIFLEGIREYREKNLAKVDMKALFPLWGKSTEELSKTFIQNNFRAIITCVDNTALDESFTGRIYDERFLEDVPDNVDPCGENGEFHSFVFDGPVFKKPVQYTKGEVVLKNNRFYFCDLLSR
jgi:uncharacterized protein (TIGR00290 family)